MGRTKLAVIVVSALLGFAAVGRADQAGPQKELQTLNAVTGVEPMQGALKVLLEDHKRAKEIIAGALPAAKKEKALSYNAAFLLALASADLKDYKTSETFFRVCMDQAAKLQSVRKLAQSYGTLIDLYYDNKQYDDAARVCKELLDLKTDDGKARVVYQAFTDEKGETDFTEFTEFDSARRFRPMVQQTLVKTMTKQGKHDAALKLVDTLINDQSDLSDRHLKVWVLREAGQGEKAVGVLEDLITKVAADPDLDQKAKDKFQDSLRYEMKLLETEPMAPPKEMEIDPVIVRKLQERKKLFVHRKQVRELMYAKREEQERVELANYYDLGPAKGV